MKKTSIIFYLLLLFGTVNAQKFAAIGDYGAHDTNQQAVADVAALVDNWNPEFIITVGDNNYPDGEASTIDDNVGQYYFKYIHPYQGDYGSGATSNKFFPVPGNHDYFQDSILSPYLDYFKLPISTSDNQRYYDFVSGDVHLFGINSNYQELDGRGKDSDQAEWLEGELKKSNAKWKIVYFHHAPYASTTGIDRPETKLRWPFATWGATAVITGHDHFYERLEVDGIPYFVNGSGGKALSPLKDPLVQESQIAYNEYNGAMLIEATSTAITFEFWAIEGGGLIDSHTITSNSNNSISWNPQPTSITSGANQISVEYNIDQAGLVLLQLFNSDWDQIGQKYSSVAPGSDQITLSLTPTSTPSQTNYLQAKLIDSNWGNIGVAPLQVELNYGSNPVGNSISWSPQPTSITSGANQISVEYNIDQAGIVLLQLFNSDWDQIGQEYVSVSPGSDQVTLSLTPDSSPTSTNYLQAKLIGSNWQNIGVEHASSTVSYVSNKRLSNQTEYDLTVLPNPFVNNLIINFSLEKSEAVSISIYSVDGKKVKEIVPSKIYTAGVHDISIEEIQVNPGIYFIHFDSESQSIIKKLYKH